MRRMGGPIGVRAYLAVERPRAHPEEEADTRPVQLRGDGYPLVATQQLDAYDGWACRWREHGRDSGAHERPPLRGRGTHDP